jgi:hypothetical protein
MACLAAAGFMFFPSEALCDEDKDLAVSQAWMQEALNRIETRLMNIEEQQKKILEGQGKLSAEHTQLRYWVHKR